MRMVGHGGQCCGVRQIFEMDHSTVADLDRLMADLANPNINRNPYGAQSGRLIEIILSQRQVTGHRAPNEGWTAALNERGFRLVSRFNNANSGNDCYIFHYVPHFKSTAPADLPFAWDHGTYAAVAAGGRATAPAAPRGGQGRNDWAGFAIGDNVVYTDVDNNGVHRTGTRGVVRGFTENGDAQILWETRTVASVNAPRYVSRVPAAPAAPPAPTVVATFYSNVYRTTGRGAFFPTIEAARAAAPRCRQQDRLDILSDGTQRWTEGV